MNRLASITLLSVGLLLGVVGVGGGVCLWVLTRDARPSVAAWAAQAQSMDPDLGTLYSRSTAALNAGRRIMRDLPALVQQTGAVIQEAERLAADAEVLAGVAASTLRGIGKALASLLSPDLDAKGTAKRIESAVARLGRLMPAVKSLQQRLEELATNAAPMSVSLEAMGNALPPPDDRPFAALDAYRRDGRALDLFDWARFALSGLLVAFGLVAFVAAFAHLEGARRPAPR
jgi:hypothetical protein